MPLASSFSFHGRADMHRKIQAVPGSFNRFPHLGSVVDVEAFRFAEVQIPAGVDGRRGKRLLERVQEFDGIPVAVHEPEYGQRPLHFPQSALHDLAIARGAGLGSGGGVDEDNVFRAALHRVEQVGPTVRIIQAVHPADQVRQAEAVVRLEHVRVVGVGRILYPKHPGFLL